MIFGLFKDWAQFIEVLGVWLSAIATFAAAYVALKVATRSAAQFVKVTAQPMIEVTPSVKGSQTGVFYIEATNRGMRDVTITHFGVRSRFPRYTAVLPEGMPGSSLVPVTLVDGNIAIWKYHENATNGSSWYQGFAEHFKQYNRLERWFLLRNLRFLVVTSLGNEFFAPGSKEFREKVKKHILEVRKKP